MTKSEALEIIMLISAMESWSLSSDKTVPDYLWEKIAVAQDILRKEILGGGDV